MTCGRSKTCRSQHMRQKRKVSNVIRPPLRHSQKVWHKEVLLTICSPNRYAALAGGVHLLPLSCLTASCRSAAACKLHCKGAPLHGLCPSFSEQPPDMTITACHGNGPSVFPDYLYHSPSFLPAFGPASFFKYVISPAPSCPQNFCPSKISHTLARRKGS